MYRFIVPVYFSCHRNHRAGRGRAATVYAVGTAGAEQCGGGADSPGGQTSDRSLQTSGKEGQDRALSVMQKFLGKWEARLQRVENFFHPSGCNQLMQPPKELTSSFKNFEGS